jgi:hypothetical protein
MADKVPLYFEKRLGGLFPACVASNDALTNVQGRVRVEIKQTRGNTRRNGLYWAVLSMCAPMLSDKIEGDALTVDMLHKILKDRAGKYRTVTLPSGQVFKDYDSIGFAQMTEPERAEFIDWSINTLSKWLGVDVTALRQEAEVAHSPP